MQEVCKKFTESLQVRRLFQPQIAFRKISRKYRVFEEFLPLENAEQQKNAKKFVKNSP